MLVEESSRAQITRAEDLHIREKQIIRSAWDRGRHEHAEFVVVRPFLDRAEPGGHRSMRIVDFESEVTRVSGIDWPCSQCAEELLQVISRNRLLKSDQRWVRGTECAIERSEYEGSLEQQCEADEKEKLHSTECQAFAHARSVFIRTRMTDGTSSARLLRTD